MVYKQNKTTLTINCQKAAPTCKEVNCYSKLQIKFLYLTTTHIFLHLSLPAGMASYAKSLLEETILERTLF